MDICVDCTHFSTVITSNKAMDCLTWAPFGKGKPFCRSVENIVNITMRDSDFVEEGDIELFCKEKLKELKLKECHSIVLLTAVPQSQLWHETVYVATTGLKVDVFCTAGLGNAIAPGDNALYDEEIAVINYRAGTINLIVFVNRKINDCAMLELVQVVSLAKGQALYRFSQKSSISNRIALGTGTDCVAICGLSESELILRYGGLGTKLGECIASAVDSAVTFTIKTQKEYLLKKISC